MLKLLKKLFRPRFRYDIFKGNDFVKPRFIKSFTSYN
jgi:hypothetical protein